MNAYDNDPRVTRLPNGDFRIDKGYGVVGTVHDCGAPNPWVASTSVGHPLRWYATADEAIHSLIGDPQ